MCEDLFCNFLRKTWGKVSLIYFTYIEGSLWYFKIKRVEHSYFLLRQRPSNRNRHGLLVYRA